MNLKELKIILDSNMPDEYKEAAITIILAKDENVVPNILNILSAEREEKKELLLDTNAELSRALMVLRDEKLTAKKGIIAEPKWVVTKIKEHYKKWKNTISCNFPLNLED